MRKINGNLKQLIMKRQKSQPEKPDFRDQLREQKAEMQKKTAECTYYSVRGDNCEVNDMRTLAEAMAVAKDVNGKIWACFHEGEDYIIAYPIK